MSYSPHYDYAEAKLGTLRNHPWVSHAACAADRAWLALRAELEGLRFESYTLSLHYDPCDGYNGRIDAQIATLRQARETLMRALSSQRVCDFDDLAAVLGGGE